MKVTVGAFLVGAAAAAVLSAAPAHAGGGFITCPSGRSGVATAVTSCAFADNVRAAYFTQGGSSVVAFSPVTGRLYVMDCVPGYIASFADGSPARTAVKCFGGNDAEVVVW